MSNEEDEMKYIIYLRGRWRFDSPVVSCANRATEPGPALEAVKSASLIFCSNFFAIISAALPFGALMNGTWPIVTTALYNPLAMRSISSSICCSDEEGELSIVYEEWGIAAFVVEGAW